MGQARIGAEQTLARKIRPRIPGVGALRRSVEPRKARGNPRLALGRIATKFYKFQSRNKPLAFRHLSGNTAIARQPCLEADDAGSVGQIVRVEFRWASKRIL